MLRDKFTCPVCGMFLEFPHDDTHNKEVCNECKDENEKPVKLVKTTYEKTKSAKKFTPSKENCIKLLDVNHETEKAYAIEDGGNGKVGRGSKVYYKYIAKSICYKDENGNIYAPIWA